MRKQYECPGCDQSVSQEKKQTWCSKASDVLEYKPCLNHEMRFVRTKTETLENERPSELSGHRRDNRNELDACFTINPREAIYELDIGDSVGDMSDIKSAVIISMAHMPTRWHY